MRCLLVHWKPFKRRSSKHTFFVVAQCSVPRTTSCISWRGAMSEGGRWVLFLLGRDMTYTGVIRFCALVNSIIIVHSKWIAFSSLWNKFKDSVIRQLRIEPSFSVRRGVVNLFADLGVAPKFPFSHSPFLRLNPLLHFSFAVPRIIFYY